MHAWSVNDTVSAHAPRRVRPGVLFRNVVTMAASAALGGAIFGGVLGLLRERRRLVALDAAQQDMPEALSMHSHLADSVLVLQLDDGFDRASVTEVATRLGNLLRVSSALQDAQPAAVDPAFGATVMNLRQRALLAVSAMLKTYKRSTALFPSPISETSILLPLQRDVRLAVEEILREITTHAHNALIDFKAKRTEHSARGSTGACVERLYDRMQSRAEYKRALERIEARSKRS